MDREIFTRRRVLAGIGAAGVATFGGVAAATDESVDYTVASTEVDCDSFELEAEWRETYTRDGDTVLLENTTASAGEDSGEEDTSTEPSVIHLGNVLPGDSGIVSFQLEVVADDSVTVEPFLDIVLEETPENGVNEPEAKAGDNKSDDDGELQEFLDVDVWLDEGLFGIDMFGAGNLEPDLGEDTISDGTLEEVADDVDDQSLGSTGDTVTVTFQWRFNPDNGNVNVTQTDGVTFTFDIYAECA